MISQMSSNRQIFIWLRFRPISTPDPKQMMTAMPVSSHFILEVCRHKRYLPNVSRLCTLGRGVSQVDVKPFSHPRHDNTQLAP